MSDTITTPTVDETVIPGERHMLSIPDPSGDLRIMWDPRNRDEVQAAREAFDEAKRKRMLAYAVDPNDGSKGQVINAFDPAQGKIIMAQQTQGG